MFLSVPKRQNVIAQQRPGFDIHNKNEALKGRYARWIWPFSLNFALTGL